MPSSDTIAIQKILASAADYGASDIHIVPGNPPTLRVDGKLVPLENEVVVTPDLMTALEELLLTPEQRERFHADKELVTATSLENRQRFKASFFYQKGLPASSLRLIASRPKSVRDLGLPDNIEDLARLSSGLVVISGPYGSGRSSTVSALLQTINQQRAAHVVTIEWPIEHLFVNEKSMIEQREVGRDTQSFTKAIETATREDVDVVMVSEMEDPNVVQSVLQIASTDRLVVSMLLADSVPQTVEKILDAYPAEEQEQARRIFAEHLGGIVCQRLLPRVGGGRIVVAEILLPTDPVRALIRDGQIGQLKTMLQSSQEEGLVSFDRYLAALVRNGEILVDDALANANDRAELSAALRGR
ncbi:MAG: PilT/PilU family type 4a pilus ATPase [Candidatus Nomurabacteria bacterium]|nr:MAG: PilT/PilU family type 4a pilus ATPase [Candidatus Nomurabacteria bacterium]